ncbi:MAG: hypothetical protein WCR27_08005 [Eubacteriales bacterium]
MDKKIIGSNNNLPKGGDKMSTVIEKKEIALKEMLSRISGKAETLTGEDNMIELNPDNEFHKEWFEEDKYKGK